MGGDTIAPRYESIAYKRGRGYEFGMGSDTTMGHRIRARSAGCVLTAGRRLQLPPKRPDFSLHVARSLKYFLRAISRAREGMELW